MSHAAINKPLLAKRYRRRFFSDAFDLRIKQHGGSPVPIAMPSSEQILAASAGWVAVLLNVIPGLGAGYLYQRRWKAYWITSALATVWFVAGAVLGQDAEPAAEAQNQLVGLIGLLLLAGGTATEAGLAVKNVRQQLEETA